MTEWLSPPGNELPLVCCKAWNKLYVAFGPFKLLEIVPNPRDYLELLISKFRNYYGERLAFDFLIPVWSFYLSMSVLLVGEFYKVVAKGGVLP